MTNTGSSTDAHISALRARAQGCLIGQLAGDALGSLVEFQSPEAIARRYPAGLRMFHDGGTWNTLAGQPTDDSELALAPARCLVRTGTYAPDAVFTAYQDWYASGPFDCGNTIATALHGEPNAESQANGALMRSSPLGIFGAVRPLDEVAAWAWEDAALTHPHRVCQEVNGLYVRALAQVIVRGLGPGECWELINRWALEEEVDPTILSRHREVEAGTPPVTYGRHEGWVLIAWHTVLWQLLHAPDPASGIIDTVARGGDTDTNAAIVGALLGAVYGVDSFPSAWIDCLRTCRPTPSNPGCRHPRPECYWPVDALELAAQLLGDI